MAKLFSNGRHKKLVIENETTSVSTQFASPASLTSRELPASQQLTAEAIAGPELK
jgi:hypothetical protein